MRAIGVARVGPGLASGLRDGISVMEVELVGTGERMEMASEELLVVEDPPSWKIGVPVVDARSRIGSLSGT